ncbi:MAG TPA: DUF4833 domain-containing protein [Myxococcales bacterium]|jgi:hypothetical protein
MGERSLSSLKKAALLGAALLFSAADAPPAQAPEPRQDPKFGPNDVATVFYVAKSDGEGRVDYGIRLDEKCKPVGGESVVPYWREYRDFKPLGGTHPCSWFDKLGYGVASEKVTRSDPEGAELSVRLKPVPREITITTSRGNDGKCQAVAKTTISGTKAELESAYLKLKRAMSVEYAELRGKNPQTREAVTEKLTE